MGDFAAFTVDEIRDIVAADDPARMRDQAAAWKRLGELCEARSSWECTAPKNWVGATADAFDEQLRMTQTAMGSAAGIAQRNSVTWHTIADEVARARDEVFAVHDEWVKVRDAPGATPDSRYVPDGIAVVVGDAADEDTLREPFDRQAQSIMDESCAEIEKCGDQLVEPGVAIMPVDPSDPSPGMGFLPADPASGGADSEDSEESMLQSTGGWHSSAPGGSTMSGPMSGSAPAGNAPTLSSTVPHAMAPQSAGAQSGGSASSATGPGVRAPLAAAVTRASVVKARQPRAVPRVRASRAVTLDPVGRPQVGTADKRETDGKSGTTWPLEHREKDRLSSRDATRENGTVPGVITSGTEPVYFDPGPVAGGR